MLFQLEAFSEWPDKQGVHISGDPHLVHALTVEGIYEEYVYIVYGTNASKFSCPLPVSNHYKELYMEQKTKLQFSALWWVFLNCNWVT